MDIQTGGPSSPLKTMRRRGGLSIPLPPWLRIFIAGMTLIMMAAGGVTHDLLTVWSTQTRLELDAARMAAAGIEFLPGAPARARLAAARSAVLCGLSPSEVVHAGAGSDRMSFDVTVQRTAPVLFFRLLGVSGVDLTAHAIARVLPSPAPPNSGGPTVLSAWPARRNVV